MHLHPRAPQVCLEGEISRQSILNGLSRGKKASGDLIPWTVSEQVQNLQQNHYSSFFYSPVKTFLN